jgi:hypothetical protein
MDFVCDALFDGAASALTVVDNFTRESLAIKESPPHTALGCVPPSEFAQQAAGNVGP